MPTTGDTVSDHSNIPQSLVSILTLAGILRPDIRETLETVNDLYARCKPLASSNELHEQTAICNHNSITWSEDKIFDPDLFRNCDGGIFFGQTWNQATEATSDLPEVGWSFILYPQQLLSPGKVEWSFKHLGLPFQLLREPRSTTWKTRIHALDPGTTERVIYDTYFGKLLPLNGFGLPHVSSVQHDTVLAIVEAVVAKILELRK